MVRLDTSRSVTMLAAACAMAVVVTLMAPVAPVQATSASVCVVRNATRGGTYGNLHRAIKHAKSGDKLTVRGLCSGRARIANKKLTIVGVRTATSGPATLRGDGKAPVLSIGGDFANVTLRKLIIRGRRGQVIHHDGGGIYNVNGRVVLKDVVVKDFKGTKLVYGGGIHNLDGTVKLAGSTTVRANKGNGAGLYNNSGTIIITGSSTVRRNVGTGIRSDGPLGVIRLTWKASVRDNAGHGIWSSDGGSVILAGRATVSGNRAEDGAGINGSGAVTLRDKASVRGNDAGNAGGGVWVGESLTMTGVSAISGNTAGVRGGGIVADVSDALVGVVCGGGGNVYGNTPDDCDID